MHVSSTIITTITLFLFYAEASLYGNALAAYLEFIEIKGQGRRMASQGVEIKLEEGNIVLDWAFKTKANCKCGHSKFDPLKRIVGGDVAKKGDWPWAAALGYQFKGKDETKFMCGGTLITTQHVLTAAHCVQLPPNATYDLKYVLLGATQLNDEEGTVELIDTTYVHENYSAATHENDIAMLTLESKLNFTEKLLPACLPTPSWAGPITDHTDRQSYVAGWGALHYGGRGNPTLRYVHLPLLDPTTCDKVYNTQNMSYQVTGSATLCAGYLNGTKDACQGDSGGGLVWRDVDTYYVIGVVSYGFKCAEKSFPGVYIRVANYTEWIASAISQPISLT